MAQERELNVAGLTPEEAQEALNRARRYKNFSIQEWQEKRKDLIKEVTMLLTEDYAFASTILQEIRKHHPGLIEKA